VRILARNRLLLADSRSLTVATAPAALYITEGQQRTVNNSAALKLAPLAVQIFFSSAR
jgi:hypothetical protein